MNDAFAQLTGPVFRYMIDFPGRLGGGESPRLEEVRGDLLGLLDDATRRAPPGEVASDLALARYALVYWIDELLINSPWAHAPAWREAILEWHYYGERLGGEEFYQKARDAALLARTDALEVFFLCVALGFQGKYTHNRADLQQWAGRTYARIASGLNHPDRFLADAARDDAGPLRPLPGSAVLLGVSLLVSASALVTLACFILASHLT
jgi:type VI secretion system protein ImpK